MDSGLAIRETFSLRFKARLIANSSLKSQASISRTGMIMTLFLGSDEVKRAKAGASAAVLTALGISYRAGG
jgi:hypothetical protein